MSQIIISSIDYNPPGNDVADGEAVTIQNLTNNPQPLGGWTLRDVASAGPHVYVFPTAFKIDGRASVKIWTKDGTNGPNDLYWGRDAAVWNNPGDIAILEDADGVEQSRYSYGQLPPNAAPTRLVIPAFWSLDDAFAAYWQQVRDAAAVVGVVVIDGSWPGAAALDPQFRATAQTHLATLPGAVLGYVSTRDANKVLRPVVDIRTDVASWYDQFGQAVVDGIYFDQLFLPEHPEDTAAGVAIVRAFKQDRPGAKAMVLAGQCDDEGVMDASVDWAVLWEGHFDAYLTAFTARVGAALQVVPSWWKNPGYRSRIVHVVHGCPEPSRQQAEGWANERNTGNLFVMDERGLRDPTNPSTDELYDHLPPADPYWNREVIEAGSYLDFGLDPLRTITAAAKYATSQGFVHGWPNGEQAWVGVHVHGTFLLRPNPSCDTRLVYIDDLRQLAGNFATFDVPATWAACQQWATQHGYAAALPTFLTSTVGGRPVMRVVLIKPVGWLAQVAIPVAATYEQPCFTEPLATLRNVHRAGSAAGNVMTAVPTFIPDDPANFQGRTEVFNAMTFGLDAPLSWADVPTTTYIAQL